VSIILGIDAGAPERTLTSSGVVAAPNFALVSSSTRARPDRPRGEVRR
jgi:hypothetical protein